MLKIAICDDDDTQLAQIQAAATHYLAKHPVWDAEIAPFINPLLLLDSLDKVGGYDVVLLDICMPGILGTDVAREIRHRRDKTEIIFLTTSDEYAVDAFALKAAHYLVKPFAQAQFDEAMTRAMMQFAASTPKLLPVKGDGGEIRCVDINEIQYIESCDHAVQFYLNTEVCAEARRSIARLHEELEKLSPGQFIIPYKGFLVNQKAIAAISPKCIRLRGGAEIPMRRGDFGELQARYVAYRFAKRTVGSEAVR